MNLQASGRRFCRIVAQPCRGVEISLDESTAVTVVVGLDSNLSRQLYRKLPNATLLSVREVLAGSPESMLPGRPFRLILNHFQPATRLADISQPVSYVDLSIRATSQILAALPGRDCRKVIYTSSASVYGDIGSCKEDDPVRPHDLPSALKFANETLVSRFCEVNGFDCTIARIFNMYGGDDRFSIISKLITAFRERRPLRLANHGASVRDFIHVDDVVRSYAALLVASDVPLINVASGVSTSVQTIIDVVRSGGLDLMTTSYYATEVKVSAADVRLLSSLLNTANFRRVTDYVLASIERGAHDPNDESCLRSATLGD